MMIALVIVLALVNLLLWSEVFYKQFFKRFYDIICALLALIVFCWLYAIIAILVKIKLGSPVLFTQIRPGKKGKDGKEKLFKLLERTAKKLGFDEEKNDDEIREDYAQHIDSDEDSITILEVKTTKLV